MCPGALWDSWLPYWKCRLLWSGPALLLCFYLCFYDMLLFPFFTVLQSDWPPGCSSNKLGVSCFRAFTPPVPSVSEHFSPREPAADSYFLWVCAQMLPSQPTPHLCWQHFLHPFPTVFFLHGTATI